MKKYLFFVLLCAGFLLASCSKAPKYTKIISEDAAIVLSFDTRQIIEKSNLKDNKRLKKIFNETLKESGLENKARKKLEAIMENPQESGVDFTDPFMLAVTPEKNSTVPSFYGSVDDKEKFTELLNAIYKYGEDGETVSNEKEYSYLVKGNDAWYFNDDYFIFTELPYSDDDKEKKMEDLEELFLSSDTKGTMAESDDMKTLCGKDGIVQMLVSGKGFDEIESYELDDFKKSIPRKLDLAEVSYLADVSVDEGVITMTGEVLTKSEDWKNCIKETEKYMKNISGDMLKCISDEGLVMIAGLDGKGFYDKLKDNDLFKKLDSGDKKEIRKLFEGIDGDVAMTLTGMINNNNTPEMGFFVQTPNENVLNFVKENLYGSSDSYESLGKNSFAQPVAYDYGDYFDNGAKPTPTAYSNFGMKKGMFYYFFGEAKGNVQAAKHALDKSKIEGKKTYLYFNFGLFNKLAKQIDLEKDKKVLEKLAKDYDYAESYYEGEGKIVVRIYLKNKDLNPLELIAEYVEEAYEYAQSRETVEPSYDYAADSTAISDIAVDSTAGYEDYSADSTYVDEYAEPEYSDEDNYSAY
ncbi:DUF4836 family protein [Prevotella sp. HUN102]|uniref:DUF4836 family protein n=1 Tax=Prevotella sp. HUN102 TaxID=1392486 RepID=UPI00048B72E8|nr:DUF4836 family protein [Prevotella sp. HUN102]